MITTENGNNFMSTTEEILDTNEITTNVNSHEINIPPISFWNILQTIVIIVITVLILLGNVTNIIIITKSIKTYGVTGYFMISLACADLGVGLLVTPLSIGASVFHNWTDIYSWLWCEVTGLVVAALCAISIYSITFLTVDKYVYIVHPMKYEGMFKPWNCVLAIILMWVVCFSYFIIHKFWLNSYYYDEKAYICSINFPVEWPFTVFVIATIVMPPAVLIFYCNYVTFKVAHKHAIQIKSMFKSMGTQDQEGTNKQSTKRAPLELNIPNQQWKALKMNILIAGAFFIAWVPYSIIQVILGLKVEIPQSVIFIIQWIAFANSFWNSIIYFHLNAVYRNTAIKMWRQLHCKETHGSILTISRDTRASIHSSEKSTENCV